MRFPLLFALLLLVISAGATKMIPAAELPILTFEADSFDNWKIKGTAFGTGPTEKLPPEIGGTVREFCENSFGASTTGGFEGQGELLSPLIALELPFLSFRLGGSEEGIGIEMLVDDEVVHRAVPNGSLNLQRITWDVSPWLNREVRFRIFDESLYDYLVIDHLVSHNRPNPTFPLSTRAGLPYEPDLTKSALLPNILLPAGMEASLFATHESNGVLAPTSLTIAEDGKVFLAESSHYRSGAGTDRAWVMDDIASQSVVDRAKLHQKWSHQIPASNLSGKPEEIRWLQDTTNDGHADSSGIYATDFDNSTHGMAGGLLSFDGVLYFGCLPNLYALSDLDSDVKVDSSETIILQDGFGVRVSLAGHDLNGFKLGPDGRIYGTVADCGLNLTTNEKLNYSLPNHGAAFRFDPDGSNFEIFHTGLRNPKDIAFNELGDAFVVDNDAGLGDQSRIVYLVEGADSGWRREHQTMHALYPQIGLNEKPLNCWMEDRMWDLANPSQPAWILPPIAHLTDRPSGLAFQPGTALGGDFENHFFICDQAGGPTHSAIYSFSLSPYRSSYQIENSSKFLRGVNASDIDFGFQGQAYISEFATGRNSDPQDRIISLQSSEPHPLAKEVAELISAGFRQRPPKELADLLSHPDQRIRLRAQFTLLEKPEALSSFYSQLHLRKQLLDLPPENLLPPPLDFDDELREDNTAIARLHATWGLGILARRNKDPFATAALLGLLKSSDLELRAQAAKALGEAPVKDASRLIEALDDPSPRVQFFAALSLSRLGIKEAFEPLLQLGLQAEENNDRYLRHAAASGLAGSTNEQELLSLSNHALPAMRMLSLLALHRLKNPGVNRFLFDHTSTIRHEAIRMIHDTPLEEARPALISVLDELLEKENASAPPLIWRRLIHSAFRLSSPENAARLIKIAESTKVPLSTRREALRLIEQWTSPFPVDQSLGRYAPLRPRPSSDVLPLLEAHLAPFLESEHPLFHEAVDLVSRYQILPHDLSNQKKITLFKNKKLSLGARIATLSQLAEDPEFSLTPHLIQFLNLPESEATPPLLRLKAFALLTERSPRDSFFLLVKTLSASEAILRQGAAIQLATHPHPEVPSLIIDYFNELQTGEDFDRAIELEMTIAAQVSPHQSVRKALKDYRKAIEHDPLYLFLGTLNGGNPEIGETLFATHPSAQCASCHTVMPEIDDKGMAGPSLANIGTLPRRKLLEALIHPSTTVAPEFESFEINLKNGETLIGSIIIGSEQHLDVLVDQKPRRIDRQQIIETSEPISSMPAMGKILKKEEIRDLMAYLTTLKISPLTKKPLAQ